MKKVLICIIFCLLSISFSFALAEKINLHDYSDEMLLKLQSEVQQEIADRHIEKTAEVPGGNYIVGKDIPVGTYVITCNDPTAINRYIRVYLNEISDSVVEDHIFTTQGSYRVELCEGEVLKCSGKLLLTISTGIQFK